MSAFGAIGQFPIGGPPKPITGTWASTEAKDAFAAHGGLIGGAWHSTEAKDTFAAAGHPELAGVWSSAEAKDAFAATVVLSVHVVGSWASVEHIDACAATGDIIEFGEIQYGETIEVFGILLEAQALANDGDSTPHGLLPMDSWNPSPQHRKRR